MKKGATEQLSNFSTDFSTPNSQASRSRHRWRRSPSWGVASHGSECCCPAQTGLGCFSWRVLGAFRFNENRAFLLFLLFARFWCVPFQPRQFTASRLAPGELRTRQPGGTLIENRPVEGWNKEFPIFFRRSVLVGEPSQPKKG